MQWDLDILCFDKSMVKAFHKNLKGQMKIIMKLYSTGNVFKTLYNPRSKMVLCMRLYENKEEM